MRKIISCILLVIVTNSCYSQLTKANYTLSINFAPSFIQSSSFTIHNNGNHSFIDFAIKSQSNIEDSVSVNEKDIYLLTAFIRTYKFQIKNSIDTTSSRKIFNGKDSVLEYNISAGLDGITVTGTLNQNDTEHKFAFWSPEDGTQNQKLISIVLRLLNQSINKVEEVNYIEQLEQYFPHGLGLKKLSTNPLKYKLYGSISSNEADQLNAFLDSLPHQEHIQIDMSNFSGMGTMFYPIIFEYWKHYKNITWINPSYSGLIDLYKMGIPNAYVISKKKIIKIENKNGTQEIVTRGSRN